MKKIETKLTISEKTFTGKDGQEHKYLAYEMELDGQTFSLLPKAEDKKLIAYILQEIGD